MQLMKNSASDRGTQDGADASTMESASARPKKDTTGRGDVTELEVALALMRSGRKVLRPVSTVLRYDLVIDDDGNFTRVQCKTGQLRDGSISFRLCNSDARRPLGVPYHGQVEAFGVHCPETRRTYLVPLAELGTMRNLARLRLTPARNGQTKGIRDASRYEIGQAQP